MAAVGYTRNTKYKMRPLYQAAFALMLSAYSSTAVAQMADKIYKTDYNLEADRVGELSVEVDNLDFFKDNEFDGTTVVSGCTLPGLWLQPKLTYQPLKNVKLEVGAHALIYDGAYKYPSYAYHDISEWKGTQYQRGTHILPFFRASVAFSNLNLVFGDIYGGSNHDLIEPMYNPELNLTADPEAGFQLLYDLRRWHLDAWINWQSFIFKEDTHQEAFTVGFSSKVMLNDEASSVHCYVPTQIAIQHRGGEDLETKVYPVQTLMNAAVGFGVDHNVNHRLLKRVSYEVDLLGYYQQSGDMWPLDNGAALYANATLNFGGLNVNAGYFACHNFISLFGLPFFGAVSNVDDKTVYKNPQTAKLSVDYSKALGKHYAVGVKGDVYHSFACDMTSAEGERSRLGSCTTFSFGVYFRATPSFLIKKFK